VIANQTFGDVEAKLSITRDAIRAYLAKPAFTLGATA